MQPSLQIGPDAALAPASGAAHPVMGPLLPPGFTEFRGLLESRIWNTAASSYSPPEVDRIWRWVYYNKIPIHPAFYLLKGDSKSL